MYGVPVLSPTGPSLRLQIFFKTFDMYWQCSNLQLQLLLLRLDIRGARALSHRAIAQAANIPYKICSVQICFSTKRKHWHSSSPKLQTFFKTNILIYWQSLFSFKRKTLSATTTCQNEVEPPEHVGKGKAKDWSPRRDCCHCSPVGLVAHVPRHPEQG